MVNMMKTNIAREPLENTGGVCKRNADLNNKRLQLKSYQRYCSDF
jgi:hypothetical protein